MWQAPSALAVRGGDTHVQAATRRAVSGGDTLVQEAREGALNDWLGVADWVCVCQFQGVLALRPEMSSQPSDLRCKRRRRGRSA